MEPTPVPTDHWIVAVKFVLIGTPTIGSGRWAWKPWLARNNKLISTIVEKGKALIEDINTHRRNPSREDTNPQIAWANFKMNMNNKAKKIEKQVKRGCHGRMMCLRKDLKEITNNPNLDKDNQIRTNEAFLANELAHLERTEGKTTKEKYGALHL